MVRVAKHAIILARVSSKAQEDEGYSLDSQLKLLRGYCDNKGYKPVKVFRIAETASKEQGRRVFKQLLEYITRSDITHLIVEKTDRLTRNLKDAVAVDDWLHSDPCTRLHAVKESLIVHKEASSDVKFMWNIHLAVAKKHTDNLREEAMKGWDEKLAQGWMPAPPPAGYKTVTVNGKRVHAVDMQTAPVIKKAFRLYLGPNQSIVSIAEFLTKNGIVTRGGRPLVKSNVHRMLMNPFYTGTIRFNDKEYPGAQETLITKKLYDAVQEKMHSGKPAKFRIHNRILKNMIQCGVCEKTVTWQKQRKKYYGSCQRRLEACKESKYIRETEINADVISRLESLVCPVPRVLDWAVDTIQKEHIEDIDTNQQQIKATTKQIKRIKSMDEMLYEDKLAGDITQTRYKEKHIAFEAQLKTLNAELAGISENRQGRHEEFISIL